MTAHVDREDMVVVHESRRDVIEGVGHSSDSMEHEERWLACIAPVEIVDLKAVDSDEAVGLGGGGRGNKHGEATCALHSSSVPRGFNKGSPVADWQSAAGWQAA